MSNLQSQIAMNAAQPKTVFIYNSIRFVCVCMCDFIYYNSIVWVSVYRVCVYVFS